MPDREKVLAVVREWMAKAENDLKNAAHTLELGDNCPTDTVCFHAQHCVEKYIKASLVVDRIDFPKTHDVGALAALLPTRVRPSLSAAEAARLADYATGARYPAGMTSLFQKPAVP